MENSTSSMMIGGVDSGDGGGGTTITDGDGATNNVTDLYDAAQAGKLEKVTMLLQKGTNPQIRCNQDTRKWGYAHIAAASEGHVAIFSALVAAGARVTSRISDIIRDGVNLENLDKGHCRADKWEADDAMTAATIGGHLGVVNIILQELDPDAQVTVTVVSTIHGWRSTSPRGVVDTDTIVLSARDLIFKDICGCRKNDVTPLMHAAAQGHVDVFAALIEAGARDTQQIKLLIKDDAKGVSEYDGVDWQPNDAFSTAVNRGHLGVVKFMLGRPDLDKQVEVEVLLETDYFKTPKATILAKMKRRDVLLKDVDGHCKNSITPLIQAAALGYFEIAKILVENGADVNGTKGSELITAVKMAAASNSPDIVELLLVHGARIEPRPTSGFKDSSEAKSAIRYAAEWGNADVVQLLIDRGALLEATGGTRYGTAMMAAARYGHFGVVQMLVDAARVKGLDDLATSIEVSPTEFDSEIQGITPLLIAAKNGHVKIFRCLLQFGAKVMKDTCNTQFENHQGTTSALLECLDGLRNLRDPGTNPDLPEQVGFTQTLKRDAKMMRVGDPTEHTGDLAEYTLIVKILCEYEAGAYIDLPNEFGLTPLIVATKLGNVKIIHMLLDPLLTKSDPSRLLRYLDNCYTGVGQCGAGACDCGADEASGTALAFAASQDNLEILKLLMARGASVNMNTNLDGFTMERSALNHAATAGNVEIAQHLLDHGALMETECCRLKGTPLFAAAEKGDVAMIELLLDYGSNIDYKIDKEDYSHDKHTSLITAAKQSSKAVEVLVAAGANLWLKARKSLPMGGQAAGELFTARGFVAHAIGQQGNSFYIDDKDGAKKARSNSTFEYMSQFMDRAYAIPEADWSPARIAIEERRYHLVGSNLRNFRQTFRKNDPRGKGLVLAATTVGSWLGAPPVCAATVQVAKAVEKVAIVGWHQDSLWREVTHWLQPAYAQAVAYEVMLCENRFRHGSSLPILPVELWQKILIFTIPCKEPAAFVKPTKVHRIVAAERKAPRNKQGGCLIC